MADITKAEQIFQALVARVTAGEEVAPSDIAKQKVFLSSEIGNMRRALGRLNADRVAARRPVKRLLAETASKTDPLTAKVYSMDKAKAVVEGDEATAKVDEIDGQIAVLEAELEAAVGHQFTLDRFLDAAKGEWRNA